ncbi:DUF3429 family protein [Sphingomonas koreensis]|nr:DUF3429 family protein [Sphingomonas koreensis]
MVLGLAGLLPAAAAVLIELDGDPARLFSAEALAFAYAALIFSFLGGIWWGLAARIDPAPDWLYGAAVAPSLIALATAAPWAVGARWPGPSLIVLGVFILASLLVDRLLVARGIAPPWWMQLRTPLSVGLGGLTLIAGFAAL